MITKPKTFEHFPDDDICPICETGEDAECILIPIDGTKRGGIMYQSIPVHLS